MSKRIGMICKLEPQKLIDGYSFNSVSVSDIHDIAAAMLEAFKDTEDFEGETLDDLEQEINSVENI